jgi:hypothetical protein
MELTKSADAPSASPFNALSSMLYEPSRAFQMLTPRRAGWLPMLLVMASTLTLMIWYFNAVDFSWLQEQMVTALPATERDAAKQFMSRGIMMGFTVAGVLVATPLIMAVTGVYLMLVSKAMNKPFTFYDGFSISAWSSLPAILSLPLGAMQILMASHGQLTMSELNPLSLNQLVFHHEMGHPMASLYDSISLPMVWSIILMVIGYEVWAKVSRATALKVVLIPYATIYGLWIAFAMSKAA